MVAIGFITLCILAIIAAIGVVAAHDDNNPYKPN